jgi:hypothetical protein
MAGVEAVLMMFATASLTLSTIVSMTDFSLSSSMARPP